MAVAKVEGHDELIYGFSKGDGFHSEDDIIAKIDELRRSNPMIGKITELFSERQPCSACRGKLPTYLADEAKITGRFHGPTTQPSTPAPTGCWPR